MGRGRPVSLRKQNLLEVHLIINRPSEKRVCADQGYNGAGGEVCSTDTRNAGLERESARGEGGAEGRLRG